MAKREEDIRESWIGAMEVRIVREELVKCQKMEGVNHYSECKHLSELYLNLMRTNKVCPNLPGLFQHSSRMFISQVKGYKQVETS